MTALLWTLAVLGAWNALMQLARVCCGDRIAWQYTWPIMAGAWAATLLIWGPACAR